MYKYDHDDANDGSEETAVCGLRRRHCSSSHYQYCRRILTLGPPSVIGLKCSVRRRLHILGIAVVVQLCLLYTSPSPRDLSTSRMPSSA